MKSKLLTKSKIMNGIQCEKKLHLEVYNPELKTPPSKTTQSIFDQGHAVGIEAHKKFPGGMVIEGLDKEAALKQTADAITNGELTLFEPAFLFDEIFVRVDILHRNIATDLWQIIEVKSSSSVKVQHIPDIAIQTHVLESLGIKIKSCSIMYINNKCVIPDKSNLFSTQDVTAEVRACSESIITQIPALKKVIENATTPLKDIGPHCFEPYQCDFIKHCFNERKIPEISIFDIPRLAGTKKWELYGNGVVELKDLQSTKLNATQKRMVKASISGERFIDVKIIKTELDKWKYPLYFLDFETCNPAIPHMDGVRPFQAIPFQYSLEVQLEPGGPVTHFEYLHADRKDPRVPLLKALLSQIGESGSIIAFSKGAEATSMRTLAEASPQHAKRVATVIARLVDPLPIIGKAVYDKEFRGSFGLKSIAPVLLGSVVEYAGLAISEGGQAATAFMEMLSLSCSPERASELRRGLLEYCKQDTTAMRLVVEWLREQIS